MRIFEFKKLALPLSIGLCVCAHSQTFEVTTTADSGPGSLRDVMTHAIASGGGTIICPNVSGTINLLSALPDIDGNLTIVGSGRERLAINGYRTNRVFTLLSGATCNLSDLAVQGSGPSLSGYPGSVVASIAILNAGSMSISNCVIHGTGSGDPRVGAGGALATYSGSSLVLNNVVVSNNVAYFTAGLSAYNVRATNCLFINNIENDGAPIAVGGDSVFSDTTFTGNDARLDGQGGGISAAGNLTLLNCNVTNNYGDWSTGGIRFNGNNLVISNCVINNNEAGETYGGIYAVATNILILNSSISGNYALEKSGGITLYGNACMIGCIVSYNGSAFVYPGAGIAVSGTLNMTNCTVTGNRAAYLPGAGVYCAPNSTIQAVNCTIVNNGSGIDNSATGHVYALNTIIANNGTGPTNGDFLGTLTSQGNNLIGNLKTNTIIVGSTIGNIYGLDPLLGPLQNNEGPTLTHALLSSSPAIDAGTSAGAPLTDQRGVARPDGKAVDIGAFESAFESSYNLRFTDISRLNSTNIHLQLQGRPGSICTIQASSDFLHWVDAFAPSNGPAGIWDFVDQDAGNHPNRFYRALVDHH
jgi:predicted outer membrane repeat protein